MRNLTEQEIIDMLVPLASEYPDVPVGDASACCDPRHRLFLECIAFDVSVVARRLHHERPTVVDIGGGWGLFSVAMAKLGARSILVDDNFSWRDPEWQQPFEALSALWRRHDVEVMERNVLREGLGPAFDGVDAFTSFHFLEHAHQSPKGLFHEAVGRLNPGGVFALAGPNSANLVSDCSDSLAGRRGRRWTTGTNSRSSTDTCGNPRSRTSDTSPAI